MEYKEDPMIKELNAVDNVNKIIALSFVIGIIFGIIIASFLHKYIVHPFGW